MRRYSVCSPITIASSTTIPRAIIKPNSDIILIVWPNRSITPNVAMNATGIPHATQKAVLAGRNKNKTSKTITRPLIPFDTINSILSDIKSA